MLKNSLYVGDPNELLDQLVTGRVSGLWTALPGIIQSFDPAALTCEVQPAIQGKQRNEDGTVKVVNLPLLLDCPVVFPRGGDCSLTFPIKTGDECLVVFSARAIDLWWQSGGVQPPVETRMHDLSDGFVIPGPYSQPEVIPSVSTEAVELRSDDGEARLSIYPASHNVTLHTTGNLSAVISGTVSVEAGGATSLKCPSLRIDCPTTEFTGSVIVGGGFTGKGGMNLSGGGGATVSGDVVADGISLKTHVHTEQGDGADTSTPHQ